MDSINKSYVSGIEIDVRITRDNRIVVIHDMTINRTSNGYGFVSKMSFGKLRKYNFGTKDNPSSICLLRDVLKVIPSDKVLLIEVKCEICDVDRFVKYFIKCIKSFECDNVYVMSFNNKFISLLKERFSSLKCGYLIGSFINSSHILDNMDFIAISSYSIGKISDYCKPVFVWAINSKGKYLDLYDEFGDSVFYIVDYPFKYI